MSLGIKTWNNIVHQGTRGTSKYRFTEKSNLTALHSAVQLNAVKDWRLSLLGGLEDRRETPTSGDACDENAELITAILS